MKRIYTLILLAIIALVPVHAENTDAKEKKNTFWQGLMKPVKWFTSNWSASDPEYVTPSFYDFAVQLQNTTSCEWLNLNVDGYDLRMRSRTSNKIGPYAGYSFLFFGYTVDLNALKGTNRRNEFTLSINSQLMNVDVIRRRTGGDFMIRDFMAWNQDGMGINYKEGYPDATKEIGDNIKYDVTGVNINYFVNHKKYSNPAAFSNGAIQLRTVGSPIIGLGYTYQKIETDLPNRFFDMAAKDLGITDFDPTQEASYTQLYDKIFNVNLFNEDLIKYVNKNYYMIANPFFSKMTVKDFHLQLGYALNIVFSRRLLLGLSFVVSPGLKVMKMTNEDTYLCKYGEYAIEPLIKSYNSFLQKYGDILDSEDSEEISSYSLDNLIDARTSKSFGANIHARASLTYNFNRWRAGFNFNANAFLFNGNGITANNAYGAGTVYVGYCFGRRKEYRHGGARRDDYIKAALSKSQIEQMRDTLPKSNIHGNWNYDEEILAKGKKTKYQKDIFDINVYGCDLVKGPDGEYGTYEITDGFIATGQDSEGKVGKGKVLEMDKTGSIIVEAGHEATFRAGNWWKSQLTLRQIPSNWYPELLHYALKGKLTFWVRSHTFGTTKPVKVEIDDFCIDHGKEASQFFQIGAKNYYSHSSYSVIGYANVNDRLTRVYIESKKNGKKINMYVSSLRSSGVNWMSKIPDDRPISRISLPGTHDAGTASLPESTINSTAHTQNFTITEQIFDGVRAFDIRLKRNMKYGHTIECRDGLEETLEDIRSFLQNNPSEFIVAMIGSDEGGKWNEEMKRNYSNLISKYSDLMTDNFDGSTPVSDVRGKILVIRRQEACPYGKLLVFSDNTTFENNGFCVEDVYKQHKTYKKIKIVEDHIRNAFEDEDPSKWYITFNSIAWDPRHHKPYYTAWGGAINIRKPMNPSLREVIESKGYSNFGMVFLDFYNDRGDKPQLVDAIINSNFRVNSSSDYIPVTNEQVTNLTKYLNRNEE